jgi:hypothetical protein
MEDDSFANVSQHTLEIYRKLENGTRDIENFAKLHAIDGMDVTLYEQALNEQVQQLKSTLSKEVDRYQQYVLSHRPQNSSGVKERQKYTELVEYSTAALDKARNKLSNVFRNIGSVIKDICEKIMKNVPRIIEMIANLFLRFVYSLIC